MYQFRREDTGEVVEVDFATMMEQDVTGCIVLADGARAKRVRDQQSEVRGKTEEAGMARTCFSPPSDALGFPSYQLEAMREDARRHGFTGVEFVPDQRLPEMFVQVKIDGPDERRRYIAHRGYAEMNPTGGGAALTAGQFERVAEMVRRNLLGNDCEAVAELPIE